MEAVEDAVDDRGGEQADGGDHDESGKKRVEAREDLEGVRGTPLGVERAGPAQKHAGFQKRIDEIEAADRQVTRHAERQGGEDQAESEQQLDGHAAEEDAACGEGLGVVLPEFHRVFFAGGRGSPQ